MMRSPPPPWPAFSGLALCAALAACSSVPASGPRTADIERGATDGTQTAGPYALIDVNQETAQVVDAFVTNQRAEGPVSLPPGRKLGLIGPGDLLQIAIWLPDPNGTSLTSDKGGIQATTRVGIDGSIGVPYVGRVIAAGYTPAQVERGIGIRLAHEAPGAQVTTLVVEDVTNAVIVQGDVVKPGRYPVVPNASGVLDVLAMAGGPHTPDRQTLVRLTRGDASVTRSLSRLVDTHALEMDLAPGDRILVKPRIAYFYAFGQVNRPGEQPYDADDITLARTLARIEGLADNHADPAAVFIYRRQPAGLTRQLARTAGARDDTRVIYRVNLRDPAGFFVAQRFPVLPDDLIYVSESPISEITKIFQIVGGLSNAGAIPRNLGAGY